MISHTQPHTHRWQTKIVKVFAILCAVTAYACMITADDLAECASKCQSECQSQCIEELSKYMYLKYVCVCWGGGRCEGGGGGGDR